jgi:hypothetical protein
LCGFVLLAEPQFPLAFGSGRAAGRKDDDEERPYDCLSFPLPRVALLQGRWNEIRARRETLMSRGPGRIERAIAAAFAASPDEIFMLDDLIRLTWPGSRRGCCLEKAQGGGIAGRR